MAQSKHQKTCTEVYVDCTKPVDRISMLPDNLRFRILALLSTKGAVSSSILSKRWQYAWTCIPELHFTDFPPTTDTPFSEKQYVCYKNFVNRVLFLSNASCLERVHLECHDGFSNSNVHEWLLVLAKRCVKKLCFISRLCSIIELPSSLLHKENLVVLNLEGKLKLYFPSLVHLPRLISLSLTGVLFRDERNPFSNFLSGCPVLEELNIDSCQGFEVISVCSSSLKILRFVSYGDEAKQIIIRSPKLHLLHLAICIVQSSINELPSLVEATLDLSTSTVRWAKLLQRFRYVKTLTLHRITLKGSNIVNQLPIFRNLTHLQVSFTPWPIVLLLLRNAPILEFFIIGKLMFKWPEVMPKSMELALKRIECHDIDIAEGHTEILKYFLSNSKFLKELTVYIQPWVSPTTEIRILKRLLELPRASSICQISIISREDDSVSKDSGSESDDTVENVFQN